MKIVFIHVKTALNLLKKKKKHVNEFERLSEIIRRVVLSNF